MKSDIYCANCGTQFGYHKGKSRMLDNEDWICSVKCLKEYALSYFGYTPAKKMNKRRGSHV